MSAKSTKSSSQDKPKKPYPGFPLFPHASGRWAKKIRGRMHYFGRWGNTRSGQVIPVDDVRASAQEAVDLYNEQRDDLQAGRTPREKSDGLTIRDLCNRFLTAKRHLLDNGEIKDRTFSDYYRSCEQIVATFGKHRLIEDLAADDFERLRTRLAKTLGPVALGNEIGRMRVVFKFAYDQSLIDRPIRYGQSFNKPSKKTIRLQRAKSGKRMFEADELRSIIGAASQPLKAMILLAANCALGQTDCANVPQSALDLDNGWLDFPRPKTGIDRHCPLWPETVEAVREAISRRPNPKGEADADLVFVTKYGNRWVRSSNHADPGQRVAIDAVAHEFSILLKRLSINGKRNFYALRHGFQTVAGEAKDPDATSAIMGHAQNDMASLYREGISDERLRAVVETVHRWLFGE